MALEPRTVTLDDGPNPELVDMTRRFWIARRLALPVFVLAMARHAARRRGSAHGRSRRVANWIGLVLATPVVFWAGWPFFERGWASIVNRSPNMFTLIALGVGAAYVYSAAATLVPGAVPGGFRDARRASTTYFETAAVITALVLLGQVLELRAREPDERRDPAAARPGARRPRGVVAGRPRSGRPARRGARRRSCCACGRARRSRSTASSLEGTQRGRRVDGHRRADAGREGAGQRR